MSLGSSPAKTYEAPSKTITVKRNPVVTITHRPVPDPDNSVLPVSAPHITNGNMADYPLSGTCTEDGENVEVTLSLGVEKPLLTTVSCTGSGTWSVTKFNVTGFNTGTVKITASHEKTITNGVDSETFSATSATRNVNRLPYVTISARDDITAGNGGTFTVSGTCSENSQPVKVIVKVKGSADKFAETGANSVAAIICAGNAWSWEVNLGNDRTLLPTGEVTITVDHSSAGSLSANQKPLTIKRKPIVTIDAKVGDIKGEAPTAYAISGTCTESNQPVTVTVTQGDNSATPITQPTCGGLSNVTPGKWSATVNVSDRTKFPTGPVTITVNHSNGGSGDLALNAKPAIKPVKRMPYITIDTPGKITDGNKRSYPLSGKCSEDGEEVSLGVVIGGVNTPIKVKCGTDKDGLSTPGKWSTTVDVSAQTSGGVTITADHKATVGGESWPADQDSELTSKLPHVTLASASTIDASNVATYTLSGKCTESGQPVTVSVGSVQPNPQPTCSSGNWEVTNLNVSSLGTGEVTITVNHNDGGNTNPLLAPPVTQKVDKVPLVTVTVDGNLTEINDETSIDLLGTCSEASQPVTIKLVGEGQTTNAAAHLTSNGITCAASGSIWTWPNVDISDRAKFPTGTLTITADHSVTLPVVDPPATKKYDALSASTSIARNPVVKITATPDITDENAGAYTFSGSCTDVGLGAVRVEVSKSGVSGNEVSDTVDCTVDTNVSTKKIWSATVDISDKVNFPTGRVTITAQHEKTIGTDSNEKTFSATPATVSNVKRRAHVSIKQDLGDITVGNGGKFTVSGTCSEASRFVSVTVKGTGTGSGSVTTTISCPSSGSWEWDVPMGSDRVQFPTGPVTITVDQTDSTGNLNAPQKTITVNRKPLVTIASAVGDGDIEHGNSTGYTAYPLSGTCTENNQEVTVTVSQGSDSATPTNQPICGSDTAGEWSTTVNVSSLGTGFVNIEVAHNNGGSLAASPARKDVKKLPHVSITTPLPKVTGGNKGNYPLSGDCSEDGVDVDLKVTGVTITSVSSVPCGANSRWSTTVDLSSAGVGAITITADHEKTINTDKFPAPTASAKISKLPVVTIVTAPSINAGNAGTYALSGTCTENGQPVTVSVGGVQPGTPPTSGTQPTCSSGSWKVTGLDVSTLATGEVTITADHSTGGDSSLNAPQVSKKVDKLPSVTVASNTSVINDETSINLSGKCSEASRPVTIKLVGEGKSDSDALTNSGITCVAASSGNTWTWSSVDISNRVKFPTGTLTITADHSVPLGSNPAKTYEAPSKMITVKRNPVITITHRPVPDLNNSVLPVSAPDITNENMANYPLSGTCTEGGEHVEVTLSRGVKKTQSTTSCTGSGTWSVTSFDISGFNTGTVTITASHEKTITNGNDSETFSATSATRDVNRLPYVTIFARGDITAGNDGTFNVSGTCSEAGRSVSVTVTGTGGGSVTKSDIPCDHGNRWTWDVSLESDRTKFPTGAVTITADQSSSSSLNAPQESTTINRKPIVTIDTTAVGKITEAKASTYVISGSCTEDSQPVTVTVSTVSQGQTNTATPTTQPVCSGANNTNQGVGTWSATVNVSDRTKFATGSVTITVNHNDGGDPVLAAPANTYSVNKLPHVSINNLAVIDETNRNDYPLSGKCSEDGRPVTITIEPNTVTIGTQPTCSVSSGVGIWDLKVDLTGVTQDKISVTANHANGDGQGALSAPSVTENLNKLPEATIADLPRITSENHSSYSLWGTCTEEGEVVKIAVKGINAAGKEVTIIPPESDGKPDYPRCDSRGGWRYDGLDVSSLKIGQITITADHQRGLKGNAIHAKQHEKVVNKVPSTSIDASIGGIVLTDQSTINLLGTCSKRNQAGSVIVSLIGEGKELDDAISAKINCDALGKWQWGAVDVQSRDKLPTGRITISARQEITIYVGEPPQSLSLVSPSAEMVISRKPLVTIDSTTELGDVTEEKAGKYTISGTCTENNQEVVVEVIGGSKTITKTKTKKPVCGKDLNGLKSASKWIFEVDISKRDDYPSGPVKIVANHKLDVSGTDYEAPTAERYVKKMPHVSIDDSLGAVTEGNDANFTVSGTCSEVGQPVDVTVASHGGGSENSEPTCVIKGKWSWIVPTGASRATFPTGDITITAFQNSGDVTIPPNTSPETLKSPEKTLVIQRMPRAVVGSNLNNISVASGGNASSYTISGKCTETGSSNSVIVQVGGITSSVSCSDGADGADGGTYSLLNGTCRETGEDDMPVWAEEGRSITTTACSSGGSFSLSGASCTQIGENITVLAGGLLRRTNCTADDAGGTWTVDLDVSDKKLFPTGIVPIRVYHLSATSLSTKGVLVTSDSGTVKKIPHVTIDLADGPDGLGDITEENARQYTLSGTCTENTLKVALTVKSGGTSHAISPAPFAICGANSQPGKWSVNVNLWNRTDFPAGEVRVTADHQKGVGNDALPSVQATRTLVKMSHVKIKVPVEGFPKIDDSNVGAYPLEGDCSEEDVDVVVEVGPSGSNNKVQGTVQCDGADKWKLAMDLSDRTKIPTGVNEVTASHTKTRAGDLKDLTDTSATHDLIRLPSVTINPVADVEHEQAKNQTISGTCSEDGQAVTLSLSGSKNKASESETISPQVGSTSNCTGGVWSYVGLDLSGWDSGHITATANHVSSGDTYTAPAFDRILNRLPGVTIANDPNDPNDGNLPHINENNEGNYEVRGTCTESGSPVHVWIGNSGGHVQGLCEVSGTTTDGQTPAYKYVVPSTTCLGENLGGSKTTRDLHIFLKGGLLVSNNMGSVTTCSGIDSFTRNTEDCTEGEKGKRMELFIGGVLEKATCSNGSWELTGWDLGDTARAKISTGALKVVALHSKIFTDTSKFPLIKVTTSAKVFHRKAAVSISEVLADITTGTDLSLKGTCSDPGQAVTVTVTGVDGHTETKNDITCDNDKTWTWNADVRDRTKFPTGSISVTADHGTGANSATRSSGSLSRHPTVTITSGSLSNIDSTNENAFTLSGTCTDGGDGQEVLVQVGGHYEEPKCNKNERYKLDGGPCVRKDGDADVYVENVQSDSGTVTCKSGTYLGDDNNAKRNCPQQSGKKITVWVGGKLLRTQCDGTGAWSFSSSDSVDLSDRSQFPTGKIPIIAYHISAGGLPSEKAKTEVNRMPHISIDDSVSEVFGNTLVFSGECSEVGEPITLHINDKQEFTYTQGHAPTCQAGETYTTTLDLSQRDKFPTGPLLLKAEHTFPSLTLKSGITKEIQRHPMVTLGASLPNIDAVNAHEYLLSGTCTDPEVKKKFDGGRKCDRKGGRHPHQGSLQRSGSG